MKQSIARHLSQLLEAIENCQNLINHSTNEANKNDARDWIRTHYRKIEYLCKNYMPSGAGFDEGTHLWKEESTPDRLVFGTSFHHMNSVGMYDGWTRHEVYVTPSFRGFNIRITGNNRNDIKDTIHDSFDCALEVEVDII